MDRRSFIRRAGAVGAGAAASALASPGRGSGKSEDHLEDDLVLSEEPGYDLWRC